MYRIILALRYLRARKITYLSILGVAMGVMALIVVLSVMEGFQQDFKGRIRGMLSDILIRYRGDEPLEEVLAAIEGVDHVTGTAPRLRGMALLGGRGRCAVQTVGVDPAREGEVSELPVFVMNAQRERPAANARIFFEQYKLEVEDLVGRLEGLSGEGGEGDLRPSDASRVARDIETHRLFAAEMGRILESLEGNKSFEAVKRAYVRFLRAARESDIFGEHLQDLEKVVSVRMDLLEAQKRTYEASLARAEEEGVTVLPFSSPTAREIIVGEELATSQLHVMVGESVQLVSGSGKGLPTESKGTRKGAFTVVGTFKSGMFQYDSRVVFMPLATAQAFQGREGLVSEIGVKIDDFSNAEAVKADLKERFPGEDIRTWAEHRKALLQAIQLEKAFLAVILFMIIVVAGFNMLATFLMMVTEKTRDLGILKALGGRPAGITTVFLLTCTLIGVIGAGLGTVAGVLITTYINEIEAFANRLGLPTPFPRGLYYLDRIPAVIDGSQIFWILAPTIVLSVLVGGVLPALKAARLRPLDALRYE